MLLLLVLPCFADFFTTAVHSRFPVIVLVMVLVYISSFSVWAVIYYFIWR